MRDYIEASINVLRETAALSDRAERAAKIILIAAEAGLPILICGNGGSAADAEHISAELVGRFRKHRKAVNAISLSSNGAALTAIGNDYAFEEIFHRQIHAHGRQGGVLIAISTSGLSRNIVMATLAAREKKMQTIAFTGASGGVLKNADVLLNVPSADTPLIQQAHVCLYHYICGLVEGAL